MKIRMIMVAAGVSALFFPGTAVAFAHPVEDAPDLTGNALYAAGKLPRAKCAKRPAKGRSTASVKRHVNAVLSCLNDTWGPYLKKAHLSFVLPRVEVTSKAGKATFWCSGVKGQTARSAVYYCGLTAEFTVQVRPDWLKASDDVQIFAELSSAYGEHVMNMVDIAEGYNALHADDGEEISEQLRRYNLQAHCLNGVSARSLWPALGYPSKNLKRLLEVVRADGDVKGKTSWLGKGSNLAYWADRGYSTGNPASCNTWTAPSGKVA